MLAHTVLTDAAKQIVQHTQKILNSDLNSITEVETRLKTMLKSELNSVMSNLSEHCSFLGTYIHDFGDWIQTQPFQGSEYSSALDLLLDCLVTDLIMKTLHLHDLEQTAILDIRQNCDKADSDDEIKWDTTIRTKFQKWLYNAAPAGAALVDNAVNYCKQREAYDSVSDTGNMSLTALITCSRNETEHYIFSNLDRDFFQAAVTLYNYTFSKTSQQGSETYPLHPLALLLLLQGHDCYAYSAQKYCKFYDYLTLGPQSPNQADAIILELYDRIHEQVFPKHRIDKELNDSFPFYPVQPLRNFLHDWKFLSNLEIDEEYLEMVEANHLKNPVLLANSIKLALTNYDPNTVLQMFNIPDDDKPHVFPLQPAELINAPCTRMFFSFYNQLAQKSISSKLTNATYYFGAISLSLAIKFLWEHFENESPSWYEAYNFWGKEFELPPARNNRTWMKKVFLSSKPASTKSSIYLRAIDQKQIPCLERTMHFFLPHDLIELAILTCFQESSFSNMLGVSLTQRLNGKTQYLPMLENILRNELRPYFRSDPNNGSDQESSETPDPDKFVEQVKNGSQQFWSCIQHPNRKKEFTSFLSSEFLLSKKRRNINLN